ncbi:unnamed protein product, partial [Urochloa humidicola]
LPLVRPFPSNPANLRPLSHPTRHTTSLPSPSPLLRSPLCLQILQLTPPLSAPNSRTLAGHLRKMDEDWELLLASPKAAAAEPYAGGGGEDDAGAIKHDYFDLGSDAKYPRRASLSKEDDEEEEVEGLLAASDNASWVEPDPDDLLFPDRDRAALWSDSSSDGERTEVEVTEPVERARAEGEAAVEGAEGAVAKGGAPVRWWKLPLDALRVWALRAARSAWSVPFAVALLGFAVLGRRLYRMRRQSKAVGRVRLVLDEKKASQFRGQASRLNESTAILRRAPIIKPMLPTNGVTPWPVLGHL